MSDDRILFYGRDLCEWALGLVRVVVAAAIIAILTGSFAFYDTVKEIETNIETISITVKTLNERQAKGILPVADKLIGSLAEIVKANRRDIDRHEIIIRSLDGHDE